MAEELGLNPKLARRAGLLHDIGKALDHDMEGTHVEIGVEVLKKYKENHLLFLYDFTAPFDNNLSERELRHIKIKQKVSGYFNSFIGVQMYSNIKSLIITL